MARVRCGGCRVRVEVYGRKFWVRISKISTRGGTVAGVVVSVLGVVYGVRVMVQKQEVRVWN